MKVIYKGKISNYAGFGIKGVSDKAGTTVPFILGAFVYFVDLIRRDLKVIFKLNFPSSS